MLVRFWWLCAYFAQYLIGLLIICLLIGLLSDKVASVIFGLGILAGPFAVWDDARNRANRGSTSYIKAENDGFDEAIRLARRNLM